MASRFILLWLFLIHKSSTQTITYPDISCGQTYTTQVPANATQYFRFLVPTNKTNAVQIDLCQSTYDTVVEIYKYKNDSAANYYDGYIGKNDDWDQSRNQCPSNTSSGASYFQLSPFTYTDVTNYTGYYILKLYDFSNQGSNVATDESYSLTFTCNPITTTLPVDGVLNCNDRQSGNLAENEWNLIRINPPPSFTKANFSFNPGFTLDSCNTNFYANYKLISRDLSEPCCLSYIGDSMCNGNQKSNGGEYLTYRKSDPDLVKWYYLNVSSSYSNGHYDIQYSCDIIPTASPTQAPTVIGGSVACGETISGIINNGETYSYSFDIPSYANNSKSVTFIDCNSKYDNNGNEEISMNVQEPDGDFAGSSWYTDYYTYCGKHDSIAVLQLSPDTHFNNRTDWNLRVSTSDSYNGSQSVKYNITYVCQDIQAPTPSPTPVNYTYQPTTFTFNITFSWKITVNITECGQELTGIMETYYNDSGPRPEVFGFNLNYWNSMMFLSGPFTINPCNTQYPLDIHVLSLTNWNKHDYNNIEPKTSQMSECANGYNYMLSWYPNDTLYGTEYVIGWAGTNRSSDQVIYDNTDRSYNVDFMCSTTTISPSKSTGNPTRGPTVHGYTYPPTTKPTRGPTPKGYTYPPTSMPSKTTRGPTPEGYTYGPSNPPSNAPTKRGQSANGDTGNNKSGLDAVPSYVWLILVIILVILFVTFLLLWYRKKKQMDAITEEMSAPYVQLTDETDNRKL